MAAAQKAWSNRIVSTGEKPASEFNFNPLNWRQHPQTQRDALNEILSKIGWVQGVIVNRSTGNLVDGHARIEEALKLAPDAPVPYTLVDLTEDEERAMLLVLDPIGAMATTDAERFSELIGLAEIDTSGLLEVIAGISRTNLLETAELSKEGSGAQELISYFAFGDVRIPMTDDEIAAMHTRYEEYVEQNQTFFGFPGELLGL